MVDIEKCQKIEVEEGAFYLGESTEDKSTGYLELNPYSSLRIHNRIGGVESLTQIEGICVMIVFDQLTGTNHVLKVGDILKLEPEGVWHIHSNPSDKKSLTYWEFDGDIRHVIEAIRNGQE